MKKSIKKVMSLFFLSLLLVSCITEVDNDTTGETITTPVVLSLEYDDNCGTVSISPNKAVYEANETVTLMASPNDNYKFIAWQGDTTATASTIQVKITRDLNIECVFQELNTDVSLPTVIIKGTYSIDSAYWTFNANIMNSPSNSEAFVIIIDKREMVYDESWDEYTLDKLYRQNNDSVFIIEISHSMLETTTYSIIPKNFYNTDSISATPADNIGFAMQWADLGAYSYRVYRKLLTENTSTEGVYIDMLQTTSHSFTFEDIYNVQNDESSDPWNGFWLWLAPIESTVLDEMYSDDSYIEIVGRHSAVLKAEYTYAN